MHDINDLEAPRHALGCSSPPTSSSTRPIAQSTSLGFPAVARVFTPHPIQDRTDDEMVAYADAAFDAILAAITRP